ncbi:hypothetical protein JK358_13635 [Nocardia sp. 2]|uniref:Uncharacterized protein n=1 Tax=Nocardia acididurans TaxID=2802282 RepID=A0ABS1M4H5_9NOCA|nr:hypothetical protein [Nocardia acididurans]MBL1075436.1 hypothetical protein [Nocardia acididurans]
MYRIRARRLMITSGIALLAVGLAACGDSENGANQTKSTTAAPITTTAAPDPTEAPSSQLGRPFTADPTIVNARATTFDSWTLVAPDKIAVNFQTGSPACYGVDATTTETDKTVTVELRVGTRADAVGKMCTQEAVFGSLEIQLKSPLGDRKVLSAK